MLKKNINNILLFIFILIIRSPGFFNISTDSDFVTYILVANYYANHQELYSNIIEVKPFFNFFPYILIILLFGKNFLLIQLFGSIIIFFICTMTIKIFELVIGQKNYLIGYIFSYYTTYLVAAGLDFQPQLTATFFYILSLFLFIKLNYKINIKLLILGFFLGCAALTRQNFIISALILTIIIPIILNNKKNFFFKNYLKNFTIISLGGIVSFIIFFVPFAKDDFIRVFQLIFISPSAVLTNTNIIVSSIYLIGHSLWLYELNLKSIPSILYYLMSLLGYIFLIRKRYENIFILNLFFLSALLGVILTNLAHNQHMIQVAPFLCIYFIYFIEKIYKNKFLNNGILLIFFLSTIFFLLTDFHNKKNNVKTEAFNWIFKYLRENLQKDEIIYINGISNNLYLLLDRYPPISIAHQSNIDKNNFLKSIYGKEFGSFFFYGKIYEIEPYYIILDKNLESFFSEHLDLKKIKEFNKKYSLIKTFKSSNTKYDRLFRNKYRKTLHQNTTIYFYKKN